MATERYGYCALIIEDEYLIDAAVRHRPDLITADMNLASGSGIRAIERISEKHQACVIYVTSDWREIEARVEARSA